MFPAGSLPPRLRDHIPMAEFGCITRKPMPPSRLQTTALSNTNNTTWTRHQYINVDVEPSHVALWLDDLMTMTNDDSMTSYTPHNHPISAAARRCAANASLPASLEVLPTTSNVGQGHPYAALAPSVR